MMLAMFTQSVVLLSDLQFATIRCSECGTEITVNLSYEKWKSDPNAPAPLTPEKCPTCDAWFDGTVRGGVDLFRKAYKLISGQKTATIEFRVRQDAVLSNK
jgi:hypothetical protein